MRVTGGDLRGRALAAPEGLGTRPTSDRVREALFNLLAHHDWGFAPLRADTLALDAFGGTGALGIEALSRGASEAVFFEKDRKAQNILRANIEKLKLEKRAVLLPRDVTKPPKAHRPCDLVFLDPPYRKGLVLQALEALAAQGWIAPRALLIVETAKNEEIEMPENYVSLLERSYGDTALSFFRMLNAKC